MKKLTLLFIVFVSFSCFSQEKHKVELTELLKDIQVWKKDGSRMSMSLWIPHSYWGIVFDENPEISKEMLNDINRVFKDYELFIAADLFMDNNSGTLLFEDEINLRKSLSLSDVNGKKYFPINELKLPDDIAFLLEYLRPMFSQMFGKMGDGMHFYVFKIKDDKGNEIINELKPGRFTLNHSNNNFEFELPLPSFLPLKNCPIDNASMKGNWIFCPIHGVKL